MAGQIFVIPDRYRPVIPAGNNKDGSFLEVRRLRALARKDFFHRPAGLAGYFGDISLFERLVEIGRKKEGYKGASSRLHIAKGLAPNKRDRMPKKHP